jgi:hypothetical protein
VLSLNGAKKSGAGTVLAPLKLQLTSLKNPLNGNGSPQGRRIKQV